MLRDEINTALKAAMKARDERRVSTLRLVNAGIKNADIEAETTKKSALSDDDLLGLLQKMIKQRQESVDIYDKAGRKELADQERGEIEIIRAYLPKQMSEAEAKAAIAEAISFIWRMVPPIPLIAGTSSVFCAADIVMGSRP